MDLCYIRHAQCAKKTKWRITDDDSLEVCAATLADLYDSPVTLAGLFVGTKMAEKSMKRKYQWQGQKLSEPRYIDKLTSTAIVHQIERYSKIHDVGFDPAGAPPARPGRAATWLVYGNDSTQRSIADTDSRTLVANQTVTRYPIHLYNLMGTRSNPNPASLTIQGRVGWQCGVVNSAASALLNKVVWLPQLGYDRTTTVNPNQFPVGTQAEWEIEDSGPSTSASGREIGRRGLLEWSEVRLLVYGKLKAQTRIKVSFVMFKDPEFAPDWEYYKNAFAAERCVSNKAGEFWKTIIQPLVNNPCTMTTRTSEYDPLIVLSSKEIMINPKDVSNSDSEPQQEFCRWFNRWNRTVDYSYESTAQLTNFQLQDPQQYPNVAGDVPVSGVSKLPNGLKGSVYLMITSFQPDRQDIDASDVGPTNEWTASYDFNIRKSTGVMSI